MILSGGDHTIGVLDQPLLVNLVIMVKDAPRGFERADTLAGLDVVLDSDFVIGRVDVRGSL